MGLGSERLDNSRRGSLVLFAIVFTAFSTNAWVTSLTPLFPEINKDIPLTSISISFFMVIPVLGYPMFYHSINKFGQRYRPEALLFSSAIVRVFGEVIRVLSDNYWVFIFAALVCALSIVLTNVMLPLLIDMYFQNKRQAVTREYAASLSFGAGLASLLAVPLTNWAGTWRASSAFWTVLSFLAAVVILVTWPRQIKRGVNAKVHIFDYRKYQPSPLLKEYSFYTVGLLGTTFMVMYTLTGWTAHYSQVVGYRPDIAGAMAALLSLLTLPKTLLSAKLPKIFGWKTSFPLVLLGAILWGVAILGMMFWPQPFMLLWCIIAGFASFSFGVVMGMLTTTARDIKEAKWLTGKTLSWGYFLSALGPTTFGVLHQFTQQWYLSFSVLLVAAAATVYFGWGAVNSRYVTEQRTIHDIEKEVVPEW